MKIEDSDPPLKIAKFEIGDPETKITSFEDILTIIKPFGKWQCWVYFWIMLWLLFMGLTLGSVLFLQISPEFQCESTRSHLNVTAGNATEDACTNDNGEECTSWKYHPSDMRTTIVTEWDLVCARSLFVEYSQFIYFVGETCGSLIAGTLADKFGRRRVILSATYLMVAICVAQCLSFNIWFFMACRLFLGLAAGALWYTLFTLAMELTTANYRSIAGGSFWSPYALGPSICCLIAYLTREWRLMLIVIAAPILIGVFYFWLMPESPRWLLVEGQVETAEKLIRKAADWNGAQIPADVDFEKVARILSDERHQEKARKTSILDIFKSKKLLFRTVIASYGWFVCSMLFFGLSYHAHKLPGNVFVNTALVVFVEIPGFLCPGLLLLCVPRRVAYSTLLVTAGAALIVSSFLEEDMDGLKVALSMVGKFAVTCGWGVICVQTTELYPTVVRAIGVNLCGASGGLGAMLAPFAATGIAKLFTNAEWLPPFVFGCVAVPAGLLNLLLPETRGKRLADHVDDVSAAADQKKSMVH